MPTNKPSRLLYFGTSKELTLHVNPVTFRLFERSTQNICITSDEKPKEGDWSMYQNKIHKCIEDIIGDEFKKIILTDNKDLIKDGVQSIDDEFLEWFVKNPTCEKVKVEEEDYSQKCRECGEYVKRGYICKRGCFMKSGNFIPTDKNIKYKIIIPKEEQKQHLIDMMRGDEELGLYEEHKQETTLEEAAERFTQLWFKNNAFTKELFIEGAKYQAKRMYSREIINILENIMYWDTCPEDYKETISIFIAQFKKK
jgi:hypothetical protein